MKGWVYVISNKAMDGLVKVGHSTKDPELSAKELNNTGSPHPYIVEYELLIEEPYQVEQAVHKILSNVREGKEWFRCTPEQAVVAIRQVTGNKQITETFKLADRIKAEELQHYNEELYREKKAQEDKNRKTEELFRKKEQQIINKYNEVIKDTFPENYFIHLTLKPKDARRQKRHIRFHDIEVNRDMIIGIDRFFESFLKNYPRVSTFDLLILSAARYLIDFYGFSQERIIPVTLDNDLWKGSKKFPDVPYVFNPAHKSNYADKVFK